MKVGWWARAKVVGKVPPSVFVPPPRVESALVEVVRHPPLPARSPSGAAVFELVEAGFGQRRKMLRRSLADRVTADRLRGRPASAPRRGPRSWSWTTGAAWRRPYTSR